VSNDSRHYSHDALVLFLHPSDGLCSALHRIKVIGENASGVFVSRFAKDRIEPSLYVLSKAIDTPCPDANSEHRRQKHQPENEGVLVVRKAQRIDGELAATKSNIDTV